MFTYPLLHYCQEHLKLFTDINIYYKNASPTCFKKINIYQSLYRSIPDLVVDSKKGFSNKDNYFDFRLVFIIIWIQSVNVHFQKSRGRFIKLSRKLQK